MVADPLLDPMFVFNVTLLTNVPMDTPVTLIEKVHDELAGMVTGDNETVWVPETAVMVLPKQEPVNPLGVDTVIPEGRESVKLAPVTATELVLLILKVKIDFPPTRIVIGLNVLVIVGGGGGVAVSVAQD